MARIWVLSASSGQRIEVNNLLSLFGARLAWRPQPNQPGNSQGFLETTLDAANCASGLARIGCPFEIESESERFLFHPGLGLMRQQLDDSGEPVLRFGQLRQQLNESAGSLQEFERRVRLLEGQAWLDLLEPYRLGIARSTQMPRAV